ncbi:Protein unc-50, partial [Cladochytrium tenue]
MLPTSSPRPSGSGAPASFAAYATVGGGGGGNGSGGQRRGGGGGARRTPAAAITTFFRRLAHFPQMDFELALWQMLYLCIAPRRASPPTEAATQIYDPLCRLYLLFFFLYGLETKNQWARDDPGFYVIFSACLAVTAIAYGIAYALGFLGTLKLILFMVFVDYFAIGAGVASLL